MKPPSALECYKRAARCLAMAAAETDAASRAALQGAARYWHKEGEAATGTGAMPRQADRAALRALRASVQVQLTKLGRELPA